MSLNQASPMGGTWDCPIPNKDSLAVISRLQSLCYEVALAIENASPGRSPDRKLARRLREACGSLFEDRVEENDREYERKHAGVLTGKSAYIEVASRCGRVWRVPMDEVRVLLAKVYFNEGVGSEAVCQILASSRSTKFLVDWFSTMAYWSVVEYLGLLVEHVEQSSLSLDDLNRLRGDSGGLAITTAKVFRAVGRRSRKTLGGLHAA